MLTSPETGWPIVCFVFGEPRNRKVQCPNCGEGVRLGAGPFRGHVFEHIACGAKFHIDWAAQIKVRT